MKQSYVVNTTVCVQEAEFTLKPGDVIVHDEATDKITAFRNNDIERVFQINELGVSGMLSAGWLEKEKTSKIEAALEKAIEETKEVVAPIAAKVEAAIETAVNSAEQVAEKVEAAVENVVEKVEEKVEEVTAPAAEAEVKPAEEAGNEAAPAEEATTEEAAGDATPARRGRKPRNQ
jgi:hypothetical protein